MIKFIIYQLFFNQAIKKMVGLEGYAPSTSPMSMGHSTIELKSQLIIQQYKTKITDSKIKFCFFFEQ
jgi:hypothetical protein